MALSILEVGLKVVTFWYFHLNLRPQKFEESQSKLKKIKQSEFVIFTFRIPVFETILCFIYLFI